MRTVQKDFRRVSTLKADARTLSKRKSSKYKKTRDCPRVTLRLSVNDHERLIEMANGMALATFIRAKVLDDQLPRKKRRSYTAVADKQAIAQILGLLGQSRIANNLNQLAYHANVGSLSMDETTQAQIAEAHDHVVFLRQMLLKALGLRG
jgi:phosphoglycerate dehydrogenase-like enzyme